MDLQEENTVDAAKEKHIPVIEEGNGGWMIKIDSTPHPMEEAHYTEWIEATTENGVCKKFLKPGDAPEMSVPTKILSARAYCNLHGLWQS